jgi:DNA-3-methyladenine glycosylase II
MVTSRGKALGHFKRIDKPFWEATKPYHKLLPDELPSKRTRKELFSALASIVVSQQLGTAAADSIFKRLQVACKGAITPEILLALSETELRGCGLSGAKVKTLKAIAQNVKQNTIDLISLKRESPGVAEAELTAIWGLGPWSVEMFLMFAVGHPDIFSPGDLGLVRAMERIYGLPKNSPRASLLPISQKWAPYRTWACLLLWRSKDNDRAKSEEVLRRARRTDAPLPAVKGRHSTSIRTAMQKKTTGMKAG